MPIEPSSWLILSRRYGGDISNPSSTDLGLAVSEIYHETIPSMTEADYAEHPNAYLRYGSDEGPMYVLDLYRNGQIVFSQWADQDFENELVPEIQSHRIDEDTALQLCSLLAIGDTSTITAILNQT